MTLANNESVIKEWTYATQNGSNGKATKTLTVTNKRIVHEISSNVARSHQEIPLNSVKSINMSSVRKPPIAGIIMIILGVVSIILGFVMNGNGESVSILLPFLAVGAILIVVGILSFGHGALTLEIATKGEEGSSLVVGTSSIVRKKRKEKKVKVKVNLKVVDEIMDTLGAIIIENT